MKTLYTLLILLIPYVGYGKKHSYISQESEVLQLYNSDECVDTSYSYISACESYEWNGETYTESGVYSITFTELVVTISGTDVTFNDISSSTTNTNYFDFTDYSNNNFCNWDNTNISNYCDSIATLILTIFNSSFSSTDVITCDSYEWNGETYTESGVYTYNTNNINDCDSTATLNLTINNSSDSFLDTLVCDSFEWNNEIYTESGVYYYSTLSSCGCDSTSTLVLEVIESPSNQNIIGQQNVEPKSIELYSITDYGNLMEWQITGGNIVSNNNSNVTIQWGDDELGLISIYESNEFCQTTHSLDVNILLAIEGCTDESACNFNPDASVDDGSCYDLIASISQSGDSLIANILPSNTFHPVNWYNVQNINDSAKYWLMAENSSNFKPTFDCSYFIIASNENCSDTSSVYYYAEEARSIGQLSTSPNPTNGKVKVNFDNINNQFVRLYLMNNSGNILDEFLTKNNELEIDLSSYPSGAYHITFNSPKSKGCLNEDTFQKVSNTIILNK